MSRWSTGVNLVNLRNRKSADRIVNSANFVNIVNLTFLMRGYRDPGGRNTRTTIARGRTRRLLRLMRFSILDPQV